MDLEILAKLTNFQKVFHFTKEVVSKMSHKI